MLRRRGIRSGPGLARTVATTAVITGTAKATSNAMNNASAQRQQAAAQQAGERQQLADLQQQVQSLQAHEIQANLGPAPAGDDMIARLTQLGELHKAGVLTDEEFALAKSRALA